MNNLPDYCGIWWQGQDIILIVVPFFFKKATKLTTYLENSQTFPCNYYNERQKTKTPFRCSYIWNSKCSNNLVLCRHCMFTVAYCREKTYNVLYIGRIPHEPRN